jgi:DNA-binding GntR family transcriptional regulator
MQVPEDSDPRPVYVQIADDLRTQISSGELPPPSRLPTLKDLTDRYGVAVETVRKGIAVLAKEGILSPGSTRGTFVLKLPGEPESDPDPDVAAQVAELRERVEEASEAARSGELRERIGTIEANLMDLYGKLGYEYPGKVPARRERKAAGS